ncbi:MAG: hypothetical protein AB1765_06920, partial [Candidatus Hydrogenedentota bacterium]
NPYLQTAHLDLDKPINILKPFLTENNINFINLKDYFKKTDRTLYFKYDAHFNEQGHEFVAHIISYYLKNLSIINLKEINKI